MVPLTGTIWLIVPVIMTVTQQCVYEILVGAERDICICICLNYGLQCTGICMVRVLKSVFMEVD